MTADIKLLPLPNSGSGFYVDNVWHDAFSKRQMQDYALLNVLYHLDEDATEIETLRADKADLEAALEYTKAHRENAVMNQAGIVKALEEIRDEYGAVIHELRAELETEKGRAEFYRVTRNWSLQKAERLVEALHSAESALADIGDADREPGDDVAWCERRARLGLRVVRDTLRDHDQEDRND